MKTRKQYLDGECTHGEYYEQFGKHLVDIVGRAIGVDRIKEGEDPHFNDIPLHRWDSLAPVVRPIISLMIAKVSGGGVSLSDCVCSAKSAASIIRGGSVRA